MLNDTKKKQKKTSIKKRTHVPLPPHLAHINKMAAGIDVGATSHFVAVPEGCDDESVREFQSFTPDLNALVAWLKKCHIETVAMESTGVYWIPLYEMLEAAGLEVLLVDARKIKNVSGRKTDVLDCQWIQQLHTYGLLSGAFRPDAHTCELRAYSRQRSMLIASASKHILHMQKALSQMNLQLTNVLSDITGVTGMKIIRAIIAGEYNPNVLSTYRSEACKCSKETIEKSLTGHYKKEHLFELKQAVELYDTYAEKIIMCDQEIEKALNSYDNISVEKVSESKAFGAKKKNSHCKNKLSFDGATLLKEKTGIDLTQIPGIEVSTALKIISEIGVDMNRWKTCKQFSNWLGLCPGNRVSGGKILSGKTKRLKNHAATAFRLAARTLHNSHTALGAFYRRMRSRLGAPKAITAAAHKLATIFFTMLKHKTEYNDVGQEYYEEQYKQRVLKNLEKNASAHGYSLIKLVS